MNNKKISISKMTSNLRIETLKNLNEEERKIVKMIEFMGYKLAMCSNGLAWESPYQYAKDDHFKIHGVLLQHSLYKFKEPTLDLLKPVIDKIGSISLGFDPLSNVTLYSSKELIYKNIIEFINWFINNNTAKFKQIYV